MRSQLRFCLIAILFILPAASPLASTYAGPTDAPKAEATRVQEIIEHLASEDFAGRRGVDARRAAEYLAREFEDLDLKPVFAHESFLQPVPGPPGEEGESTTAGWNVTARYTHPEARFPHEYVIIAAHHDHLGRTKSDIYFGADDNASGVAMLLEAARLISSSDQVLDRSVLFVSFDLEEHLLFGSRWWTAHAPVPLEQVKFIIVADMLGRSLGDLPLETVFLFGAEHGAGIRESIRKIDFGPAAKPTLLSDDFVGLRSDYGPFRDREIPFVFASTGQSRDYHTPQDTADKIDFEQVATISTGLTKLLIEVAGRSEPPRWILDPPVEMEEVAAIEEICAQIRRKAEDWKLTPVQRFFVDQASTHAAKILRQDEITPADQAWLTRTTQLLLFSVF
ncbi:M28 family metallopeptidase [Rubinisphaera margarita]|uniref:M28 family metallopeptidase n=1 Tax=Rubinisphaera margarita TaxID=2909586 RepID=UPI001EE85622|nr:M28 family peptidase [Rubinisphaera margarita]MCG6157439.1 M28 family peptidase [Rubinisphaera margarita]